MLMVAMFVVEACVCAGRPSSIPKIQLTQHSSYITRYSKADKQRQFPRISHRRCADAQGGGVLSEVQRGIVTYLTCRGKAGGDERGGYVKMYHGLEAPSSPSLENSPSI